MRQAIWVILCSSLLAGTTLALEAEIVSKTGEVKVRRGVDEHWQTAAAGLILKEIDTIITGEAGEVILKIEDGLNFRLGANAILDIADLRKISKQQLYVYLTQQKLDNIEKRDEKTELQITNTSVVHGTSQESTGENEPEVSLKEMWIKERNGAKALYDQQFYPNTIIKLYRILSRYKTLEDCGETHYYLGKSFEALAQAGQATDAYQTVVTKSKSTSCKENKWTEAAHLGLERLKE